MQPILNPNNSYPSKPYTNNFDIEQIGDRFLITFKGEHRDLTIDGVDVSGDFSLVLSGFVATLSYNDNDVATFTVDPETGSEQIASLDADFWNGLDTSDSIVLTVGYTVTDGDLTDAHEPAGSHGLRW